MGSSTSSDHDRTEGPPVRSAGVEQGPDPVVVEVADAEADPFDGVDRVVERRGGSVGHLGQVVVADVVGPPWIVRPSFRTSGAMARLRQWAFELVEDPTGLLGVARP